MFTRREGGGFRPKLFNVVIALGLVLCATTLVLSYIVLEAVVARPYSPINPLLSTQIVLEKKAPQPEPPRKQALRDPAIHKQVPDPPVQKQTTHTHSYTRVVHDGTIHIPVVVVTCKRAEYLDRSLEALVKYMPENGTLGRIQFSIIVSRDCFSEDVEKVISGPKYAGKISNMRFRPPEGKIPGHEAVARHYGWIFSQIFDVLHYPAVLVVEEDMEVSPDFYEYFAAGFDLLNSNPDIMCVSAWNDNGLNGLAEDIHALYITDIFPGLGWMMLRGLWEEELRGQWPTGYWDEFMRMPSVRKGRVCVRPEVSRAFNYGERGGVNKGQFYKTHLAHILRNTEPIKWTTMDKKVNPFYNGSLDKQNFDAFLYDAIKVDSDTTRIDDPKDLVSMKNEKEGVLVDVVTQYTKDNYASVAKMFGLMTDLKEGIPRCSYKDVIIFKWHGFRVFLALDKVYDNPDILLQ